MRTFMLNTLMLRLFVVAIFCGLIASPVYALHPEDRAELENLRRRIAELETRKEAEEVQDEGFDSGKISKYLSLHGLLEVEAYYANANGGDNESDISLATAELSLEATLNENIGGHLILLYEEEDGEDEDIAVDEGVISLSCSKPLFGQTPSLHAGKMYLPFGMFNSAMISDPLTLELGETQNTALLLAFESDLWTAKSGVFNGDVDEMGDNDHIDSWVAALEFFPDEMFNFGASYLSDLAESDADLVTDDNLYVGEVDGVSVFVSIAYGPFGFDAEYLTALDDFDQGIVAAGEDLTGKRPAAWNLELSWLPTERLQLAARYEQAHDYQSDVHRYGVTASYGFFDHVIVALEYLHADAKAVENDPLHVVTGQLALEF